MADLGFPREGTKPRGGNLLFCQILSKTAWKWRKLDQEELTKILLYRSATDKQHVCRYLHTMDNLHLRITCPPTTKLQWLSRISPRWGHQPSGGGGGGDNTPFCQNFTVLTWTFFKRKKGFTARHIDGNLANLESMVSDHCTALPELTDPVVRARNYYYRPQRSWARLCFYTCLWFCTQAEGVVSQHALQVVSQHALQQVF